MSDELKPCPFCGGEAVMSTRATTHNHWRAIQCKSCSVETNYFPSYQARDEWNSRCEDGKENEWKRYPEEKPNHDEDVWVYADCVVDLYTFQEEVERDEFLGVECDIWGSDVDDVLYWQSANKPEKPTIA